MLYNNSGYTFDFAYTFAGIYTITPSPNLPSNVAVFMTPIGETAAIATVASVGASSIVLNTFNTSGSNADFEFFVTIRIFE